MNSEAFGRKRQHRLRELVGFDFSDPARSKGMELGLTAYAMPASGGEPCAILDEMMQDD
jgi:hypothetical protein